MKTSTCAIVRSELSRSMVVDSERLRDVIVGSERPSGVMDTASQSYAGKSENQRMSMRIDLGLELL